MKRLRILVEFDVVQRQPKLPLQLFLDVGAADTVDLQPAVPSDHPEHLLDSFRIAVAKS